MAKKYKQLTLKPGRYHVGDGKFIDLDAAKLKSYVDGTKAMLTAGLHVPMILEHAEPGSADGSPRDARAAKVKHGAGWLNDIAQGADGSMTLVVEPTDADAAKKIADGSIRFTSPELRNTYTDGKGRTFENVISHVALTHRPRNPDQTKFEPLPDEPVAALQFSLADIVQMSDEKDEDERNAPSESAEADTTQTDPENPDMPKDEAADGAMMEAIMAHLEMFGVSLPSDTTDENFKLLLLTALKTAKKSKDLADSEKADKEDDDARAVEETPPMQFSLADVEAGAVIENKALSRLIRHECTSLGKLLDAGVSAGRISPAMRDQLVSATRTVQFSAEGDEQPSLCVSKFIRLLCESPVDPAEWRSGVIAQMSAAETEEHPAAGDFYKPPESVPLTPEQVEAAQKKLIQSSPGLFKSPDAK